ncbi:MAG TPA: NrfD/PsrC family molybdoenzyme membrane anchor subunit [Thermomicrobiales bacterium]|nr:NrfD/PsrC family molybdoenzyme membrane anchor subunit [Thermomicrobiales bacterium]
METRNTTTERAPGYYGLPVLKRPHWKWEIALYFWCGGVAAGAYLVAAVADLCGGEGDRATVRAGRLVALPLLLASPPLLIKDLGRPEKFYNMLRIFKLKSPMSAGTWGLTAFGGFVGLSALLELLTPGDGWRGPRRAVAGLGAPFALFVGGYTGVLISATAIPLWAKNRLLWGPTFLASAFSTGIAAIEAALTLSGAGTTETLDRLDQAHLLGLSAEAGLLAAGLARLGPTGHVLTRGRWSSLFVPGAVGLGVVLPAALSALRGGRRTGRRATGLKALGVLLGGLIFRFCVVYAGKDSADDPRAYFALTSGRDGRE